MNAGTRAAWETDDVALLRETARRFFASEAVPNRQRWEQQRYVDREFWVAAGKLGLVGAGIPTSYGGGGGTIAHDVAILEEQARIGEFGFGNHVHSGIVAHYLNEHGTAEQREQWLPMLATGEVITALAMTEPGAGSDLQALTTRARRDGDGYVIDGAKTFITNGSMCDLVIVVATTDPSRRGRGLGLFIVETDAPGFRRGRVLDKIGQHSADTSELFFDGVRVPADHLLGGVEGQGFAQLMGQLPRERLLLAAMAATATEVAVEETLRYVREREVFGKPLFELQNTRFVLAECATKARAARVFVDHCVGLMLGGELDLATAAMAKWWLADVQCEVVDRCLQFFGGYGYVREYPIARMYADARVQKIYAGSNEVMKELIARSL